MHHTDTEIARFFMHPSEELRRLARDYFANYHTQSAAITEAWVDSVKTLGYTTPDILRRPPVAFWRPHHRQSLLDTCVEALGAGPPLMTGDPRDQLGSLLMSLPLDFLLANLDTVLELRIRPGERGALRWAAEKSVDLRIMLAELARILEDDDLEMGFQNDLFDRASCLARWLGDSMALENIRESEATVRRPNARGTWLAHFSVEILLRTKHPVRMPLLVSQLDPGSGDDWEDVGPFITLFQAKGTSKSAELALSMARGGSIGSVASLVEGFQSLRCKSTRKLAELALSAERDFDRAEGWLCLLTFFNPADMDRLQKIASSGTLDPNFAHYDHLLIAHRLLSTGDFDVDSEDMQKLLAHEVEQNAKLADSLTDLMRPIIDPKFD
ncbi:MAG: hypothetical protein ACI8W8_004930 [Rhodothermales bacterium]|jgi:hypothetical protein